MERGEDKGLTLSVHYRLLGEERVDDPSNTCEETVRGLRSESKIRTTEGKEVCEIRPGVLWDMEDDIVLLMSGWISSTGKSSSLTSFLEDDLTDEGGFKMVDHHGGSSIFVGESGSSTAGRYFLRSPDDAAIFLRKVAETVGIQRI